MDRNRFSRGTSRESKGGSITLQKKLAVEARHKAENVPDLTDFMNDMFFGTVNVDNNKVYNLTGGGGVMDEDQDFDSSTRSNSSKQTQEWLEEARRLVASSPSRSEPPSRLIGSPRFAVAQGKQPSLLDRRDPLSRSARRNQVVESFSGEILTKSAKRTCNNSGSLNTTTTTPSTTTPSEPLHSRSNGPNSATSPAHPPRVLLPNRPSSPRPQGISLPSRRNQPSLPDSLTEKQQQKQKVLSPSRNLVESAHRRSISSSTCSLDKIAPMLNASTKIGGFREHKGASFDDISLNGFLKHQRIMVEKLLNGEVNAKAKIVLSEPSNSTSSIVAVICYAWLLENRMCKNKNRNKGEGDGDGYVVVPVINVRRRRIWKQRQAAWLLYHVGVDATSLLFADENRGRGRNNGQRGRGGRCNQYNNNSQPNAFSQGNHYSQTNSTPSPVTSKFDPIPWLSVFSHTCTPHLNFAPLTSISATPTPISAIPTSPSIASDTISSYLPADFGSNPTFPIEPSSNPTPPIESIPPPSSPIESLQSSGQQEKRGSEAKRTPRAAIETLF
ncbi:hypothetical protein FCV25MIE_10201 [Fagus crenata]